MRNNSPYDCKGKFKESHKKAFNKLPFIFKSFIKIAQTKIQKEVERLNPNRKIRATSGFRSISANRQIGGVVDSLHLFGLARDFAFDSIDKPLKVPSDMEIIRSANCWHVQFSRRLNNG